jgi:hypothetical protein
VAGRFRTIEKSNYIGNRTRDFSACSIVPQVATVPRVPTTGRGKTTLKAVACREENVAAEKQTSG